MRVLITGGAGQLATELKLTAPDTMQLFILDKSQLDITDIENVKDIFSTIRPELVINCAAYNKVDLAEDNPELAFKINSQGASNIALVATEYRSRLIHISTDYVFDGKHSIPYKPEDEPNPISVYGKSKLEGEINIKKITDGKSIIIRTSWLYSSHGNNFFKTIMNSLAKKERLRVVDDQIGTPTNAHGLARFIWKIIKTDAKGIYHWTDSGIASWYDFAVAIQEEALQSGKIHHEIDIEPCNTHDYPFKAERPSYSVLDTTDAVLLCKNSPRHWRKNLRDVIGSIS